MKGGATTQEILVEQENAHPIEQIEVVAIEVQEQLQQQVLALKKLVEYTTITLVSQLTKIGIIATIGNISQNEGDNGHIGTIVDVQQQVHQQIQLQN